MDEELAEEDRRIFAMTVDEEEEFLTEEVDQDDELSEEEHQLAQSGDQQEEHITMESVHEFQPAEVEYVTIKNEFETIVTEEDEFEVMNDSGAHDAILDCQMIVIPAEGAIDEVIGEETLELEGDGREEHLVRKVKLYCTRIPFILHSPTHSCRRRRMSAKMRTSWRSRWTQRRRPLARRCRTCAPCARRRSASSAVSTSTCAPTWTRSNTSARSVASV